MVVRSVIPLPMLLAAAAAAPTPAPTGHEGQLLNAVVALVNGEPVTKMEVDARVVDWRPLHPDALADEVREAWNKAREAVIEHRLLIQEARRRPIEVSPEEVNDQMKRLEQASINVEGQRDMVRQQLMVQRLLRHLITARHITPQEVGDYYREHQKDFELPERHRVYLIAIHADRVKGGRPAAKKRAEELLAQLRKGTDFVVVAKAHSQGAFAAKGGDQGWVRRGSLLEPLDEAIGKLQAGEISDLIETKGAFYIARVAAVQPASRQSLAKARATILERLHAEHRLRLRRQLVERLRRAASILRFDLRPD